jgi:5'-nucleotidase
MKPVRLLLLFVFAGCATVPQAPPHVRFKILQVNDVYKIEGLEGGQSGGLARVRTLRKHLESDGTPVLLLHGGDLLYPSVMSKYLEAKPMIEVMNLLDGDAAAFDPRLVVTFGNHEFDKNDATVLLARLGESGFQWVSSNTRWCNPNCNQTFPKTVNHIVYDVGGTKVGLFGLIYPMQKSYVQSSDPAAAARDAVAALRGEGARVVIAVTHQDMGDDIKVVEAVPGIDLVIGGHDHLFMQDQVNGTWITKADADAKSVIVYDVTVPPAGPIRTTPLRLIVDSTIPKDPAIDASVQRWLATLSGKLGGNETLGTTQHLLEGVEPAVRGRETALGNLLADVAREQMQTDVGLINGGSIRINDNIPPGPITSYHMEGVFYYTNTLVGFSATGQQLLDLLRNGVSRADAGDGRFLQVSGLAFRYHPRDGAFVVNAEDVSVGGRPLDVNARYTVATLDYVYMNGVDDGFTLFAPATRPPKVNTGREDDFRKTTEKYIRGRKTITNTIEGRIVREEL